MTRCQHCNKLTHSEDLNVEFSIEDIDKVTELQSLTNWVNPYMYRNRCGDRELGKLKCGDIWIHFIAKKENENGDV